MSDEIIGLKQLIGLSPDKYYQVAEELNRTCTADTVALVSSITRACKTTISISTTSISVTVVCSSSAFVYVWKNKLEKKKLIRNFIIFTIHDAYLE